MEISALQKIVRDRYFKTDNERGIYHTALWFHEEVGELSAAIASGDIQNAKEELGDVLMWLLTLANLLDIDMEDVIKDYLNNPRKNLLNIVRVPPWPANHFITVGFFYLNLTNLKIEKIKTAAKSYLQSPALFAYLLQYKNIF